MSHSWIVSAQRTPIGKFLGGLSSIPASQLAATVIASAIERADIPALTVDEVILGQVLQAGAGQAPARQAALAAGIDAGVPAVTINKVCGSGLKAIMLADQAIRAGDAKVIVAGGMENMSRAPHLLPTSRSGTKFGPAQLLDSLLHDGLTCSNEGVAMGCLADATALAEEISRDDQDAFALESHRRAVAAQDSGWFLDEIVPVAIGGNNFVADDEGPRRDATPASLQKLRTAFGPQGTATAGNASQLSDGAAAVVVVDEETAQCVNSAIKAKIVATATSGRQPYDLFLAPIDAVHRVLHRAGLSTNDIDLFEINEAFASQCLACQRELRIPLDRLNVHGGAIALGHPIGASGARVLVTLLHALTRRGLRRGLATLCLGGGNAVAVIIERET